MLTPFNWAPPGVNGPPGVLPGNTFSPLPGQLPAGLGSGIPEEGFPPAFSTAVYPAASLSPSIPMHARFAVTST